MQYVFYVLLAYFLWRFIFSFVVPLVRTTRQVRRSFKQMNEQFGAAQQRAEAQQAAAAQKVSSPKKASNDDYIDFEEIK
ncbi:hypothetical protein [Flaviaesturariibacter amylovorans]|uniref:DUF4834 family protein n=1 Tax=Flaviaesturariibacter amylovorans TaxID=1084520 RepID=A0ABP8HKB0_9BACT